jgi:hypothetical protein
MTREEFQLVALLAAAALGYVACLLGQLIDNHRATQLQDDSDEVDRASR